ncbi:hypothetical protein SEA_BOBSWAGET_77 [Mycobacterium phage BobSwaget]|nr:hypothetical protein SEA_BOBSWAGET_77 [Mycobacterium phage BobSwaget]QGH78772.1 hypothetical protein SEA_MIKO_78 [Mycobacterium phage Miko]
MRRLLLIQLMLAMIAVATLQLAAPAHAEVSALCWAHLAESPAGTTPASDRRYHLERGQESPCTEQDAASPDREGEVSTRGDASSSHDDKPDEGKSRYCRKHWFC